MHPINYFSLKKKYGVGIISTPNLSEVAIILWIRLNSLFESKCFVDIYHYARRYLFVVCVRPTIAIELPFDIMDTYFLDWQILRRMNKLVNINLILVMMSHVPIAIYALGRNDSLWRSLIVHTKSL